MSSDNEIPPKHNEQADFISLLTRHQMPLRAYIVSLMPGMNGASDVLQEVNIILWEKSKSFKPGGNFLAWAFAIARYEVKNFRRKQQRRGFQVSLSDDLLGDLAEYSAMSSDMAERKMRALEVCLGKLNQKDIDLIKARYLDGGKLSDRADDLGYSPGSLRVILHRIRRNLKKCIDYQLQTQP